MAVAVISRAPMMTALDRVLLGSALAAPLVYWVSALVAAAAYPGYRHRSQFLSDLGTVVSPRAAFFNAGLVVTGGLEIAFAVGGLRLFWGTRAPAPLVCGFVVFGLTTLLMGVFPCDPGCPRRPATGPGAIHGALGLLGAAALTYTMVATGMLWGPNPRAFAVVCWTEAILSTFLLAALMTPALSRWAGVLQRLYVASAFGWPLILAALTWARLTRP